MEAKLKTYSVKDWGKLYENNRTRDLVEMKWVPVPNRHDGDGYTTLVCREDGAAMLGCWLAILQVASKCNPRGSLIRHNPAGGCGDPAGKCGEVPVPHTAATLSRITRLPEQQLATALDVLEYECKWLISNIPQEGAAKPQEGAAIPHPSAYGKEGKGIEGKGINTSSPDGFDAFWSAYPKKVGKALAEKKFKSAIKRTSLQSILGAVESQKQSDQWKKDGGQFIPNPATWLHQGRWDDVPMTQQKRPERRQMEEQITIPILNAKH